MERSGRRRSTGMKHTVSAPRSTRSRRSSAEPEGPGARRLFICISNRGYPASLEFRKVYDALPDDDAAAAGFLRVVDESGEDYLFPGTLFAELLLPPQVR